MNNEENRVREERFKLLLEQIGMPAETLRNLEGGRVEKLSIWKDEKKWHFQFKLPAPLPYTVFLQLEERLSAAFRHICSFLHFV